MKLQVRLLCKHIIIQVISNAKRSYREIGDLRIGRSIGVGERAKVTYMLILTGRSHIAIITIYVTILFVSNFKIDHRS